MATDGKWHFIGIGGVGMSGIAKAWLELGNQVSGSDLAASPLTDRLSLLGADVHIGQHDPVNITDDVEAVVVSSAIRADNPELLAAREKGLDVIHRGACLARLMQHKRGVAVSGAHGKTTTSSMIAFLLERSGMQPAFFIGAHVEDLGTNGRWGEGEYMVAEADESDGSFLELSPEIAVVTNVEDDHLDYYNSMEKIDEAFLTFAAKAQEKGLAVLCLDDPGVKRLMQGIARDKTITYGTDPDADLRGRDLRYENGLMMGEVSWHGEMVGTLTLQLYGKHNLLNAMAAAAVGRECGLGFEEIFTILREFRGAHRRLEYLGETGGVKVYDDYAHHPTEIKATLDAAGYIGANRLLVMFQPHRYTRTLLLAKSFGVAFDGADELILLPVYSAGEDRIEGADVGLIAEEVDKNRSKKAMIAAGFEEASAMVAGLMAPGDMVLTMGAGDIRKAGELLLIHTRGVGSHGME